MGVQSFVEFYVRCDNSGHLSRTWLKVRAQTKAEAFERLNGGDWRADSATNVTICPICVAAIVRQN